MVYRQPPTKKNNVEASRGWSQQHHSTQELFTEMLTPYRFKTNSSTFYQKQKHVQQSPKIRILTDFCCTCFLCFLYLLGY